MESENMKKDVPTILIVDDISMNVEILENIISHAGYKTLCALSVEEAIDLMKETMPTLVLSDLSMPEVDGLEFCRILKSDAATRDIPFIFITVLNTSEEKKQAFLAGAVDFIPKPFDAVEVIMRVNNHLNSYRMQQEMADYNRKMHKLLEFQKQQLQREQKKVLLAVEKIMKKRNSTLGEHLDNVGYYCGLLAQGLQFLPGDEKEITDEFVETIDTAAKIHGIGSFVVAEDANSCDGDTDGRNLEYIKKCSEEGAKVLEEICADQNHGEFLSMAVKIARYYRANWDGTGYPGLKGEEIPLEARITALANDFDNLVAERRDKQEDSMEEIIQIINDGSGSLYDPDIVKVFNKIWRQMIRA